MDIYIKPKKKAEIVGRDVVTLGDVADVFAEAGLKKRVEKIHLLNAAAAGAYVVSVLEVVAAVTAALPGHSISNLGEMDTYVVVKDKPAKKRGLWTWTKVALISLVLFAGSATAIMAFHSEAQLGTVFKKFYEMFFGHEVEKPYIITIPYSIGLAAGIMLFFNHFGGKKFTKEPTPIEVEMEKYESDSDDAMIEALSRKKEKTQ